MAPITLTPKQFRATPVGAKPGSNYNNYLAYIRARRTTAPRVVTPAAPVDPMASILTAYRQSILTPQALQTSTLKSVQDQINATIAANNAGVAGQNTQLGNQAQRAQGFALALAKATAPDPDQIKGFYQEAADRLRGYGTGLTGAVANDWTSQADTANADVARVTGGLGESHGYDAGALRNAAQMSGVVIPGASLESQAAAAAANAGYARAASAGNIGLIAQQYLQKQNDLQTQLEAENAAVRAKQPELFASAYDTAQQRRNSSLAAMVQAEYLANTMRSTGASITGVDPVTGKPTVAATVTKQKLAPIFDSARSGKLGYRVDQYGQPLNGTITPLPGYKLNKAKTGVVKTAKPVTLTPTSRSKALSALDIYHDGKPPAKHWVSDSTAPGGGSWIDVPNTDVSAVDYNVAITNLMSGFGMSRAQATAFANQRYKPGQYGRPRSKQQIAQAKKSAAALAAGKRAITDPLGALIGG